MGAARIHAWNHLKTSENEKKSFFFQILSTPQSWSTCKSWSTPWGGTSNLSLLGWFYTFPDVFQWFLTDFNLFSLILKFFWVKWSYKSKNLFHCLTPKKTYFNFFVHFQMFFVDFRREITEKGLKLTKKVENGWKKVVRPAFSVQAPESWSKYTTPSLTISLAFSRG